MNTANLSSPCYLESIGMFFYAILLSASLAGQKLTILFGFAFSAGTLIFPITYMIIACITELYGLRRARRIILTGAFCNFFVAGYLLLTVKLEPAPFWLHQVAFAQTTKMISFILLTSTLAYLISEYVNAKVISKLKVLLQGRWLLARAITSTSIAAIVDSTLMLPIIIYNSPHVKLRIYVSLIFLKIMYEVILLPVFWLVVGLLEMLETKYQDEVRNPFSSVTYMTKREG